MGDRSRSKCSQKQITKLLDSEVEMDESEHESNKKSSNTAVPKNVPEKTVSIKLRLRRSTEQSNYKVVESSTRHSSRLNQVPRKSFLEQCITSSDEDDYIEVKMPVTPKSKPGSRNDENEKRKVMETPRTRARNSMIQSVEKMTLETPRKKNKKLDQLLKDQDDKMTIDNPNLEFPNFRKTRDRSVEIQEKTMKRTNGDESDDGKPIEVDRRLFTPRKKNKELEQLLKDQDGKIMIDSFNLEVSTPRMTRAQSVEVQNEIVNKENSTKNVHFDVEMIEERERIPETPRSSRKIRKNLSSIIEQDENMIESKKNKRRSDSSDEDEREKKRGMATLRTPARSIKVKALTPSMKQRTVNIVKQKSILEEARAQLHVSAIPKSLPCREKEFNEIFTFLNGKLRDGSSGCMYISGVPGTGKTATVNEVLRGLKKLVSKGELEDFDYIEINGMKLSEPRQSYVQIMKQLTGISMNWEEALTNLNKRFNDKNNNKTPSKRKIDKGKMTLLLIDELDLLCNKRQDVVYNLLDWPSKSSAQLVVITIANTMDLPERVLMSRVTSRLGLTRLTFHPYNFKQLQEIIITRLKESDVFRSDAIQLVARKVAAVSGDARRALDICRRTTEIAELHGSNIVAIEHVNEALKEMIANPKVRAIKLCSLMEKLFLQSVCAEITRTGIEETNFINIYRQFQSFSCFKGGKCPNVTQMLEISSRLCANRLILSDNTKLDIQQRIFLNVSVDDIYYALEDVKLI